jgi:hypothetical protein
MRYIPALQVYDIFELHARPPTPLHDSEVALYQSKSINESGHSEGTSNQYGAPSSSEQMQVFV